MAEIKQQKNIKKQGRRNWPSYLSARTVWDVRRAWKSLGWMATLGLFCGGLVLQISWQIQKLESRQKTLSEKLTVARNSTISRIGQVTGQEDLEKKIEAFYQYLPQHEAIPDQLKSLINLAQKSGIVLSQADYKPQPEVGAEFIRYQILLPVKSAYPNIQDFILAALQELPTLTLESVTFKRERIESIEVEAKIHFVLLVKKAQAAGGVS